MCKAPFMSWYVCDYIAKTQHLSLEEHGAYRMLLDLMWIRGGVPFPDDDRVLAKHLRVTVPHWRDKLRPVLEEFFDLADGFWRNRRLEEEWAKAETRIEQSRDAGAKGGRATALKNNNTDAAAATAHQTQILPSDSPAPKVAGEKDSPQQADLPGVMTIDQEFDELWPARDMPGAAQFPKVKGCNRKSALIEYRSARKRASREAIFAGVFAFSAAMADRDPQFITHPERFLRKNGWETDWSNNQGQSNVVGINIAAGHRDGPRGRALSALARSTAAQLAELRDQNHSAV